MANVSQGGFRFVGMRNGAKDPMIELRVVADAYGTGIFKGDPVKLVNDGTVSVSAAGELVYGVCDGVEQYWDGSVVRRGNYLPASTSWGTVEARRSVVRIIRAQNAIFEVDADDGTTATTEATFRALVNENADHIATASGSTTTGLSGYKLDISDHKTTTAQWRLIGLSTRPDNDYTVINAKVLVTVNETNDATLNDDDGI